MRQTCPIARTSKRGVVYAIGDREASEQMDELQRVTFRFAGHMEVQYLAGIPDVGDRVSHDGDLWVVTSVDPDAVGALVSCELPRPDVGAEFDGKRRVEVPSDTTT